MIIDLSQIEYIASGLDHPEDLALGEDGSIYTGGELGQIYRVNQDGEVEEICRTGGYSLGMNFGPDGQLYVCDSKLGAVVKVSTSGEWSIFAEYAGTTKLKVPNYPVFDRHGHLYVSDSGDWKGNNGFICRFSLNGQGEVFSEGPYQFPNGLALNDLQDQLLIIESNSNSICSLEIQDSGKAGAVAVFAEDIYNVPDGMAFDRKGNLYVSCFANNRIYRIDPAGNKEILIEDPDGILIAAPTNCIVGPNDALYFANLNSDFIGKIKLSL